MVGNQVLQAQFVHVPAQGGAQYYGQVAGGHKILACSLTDAVKVGQQEFQCVQVRRLQLFLKQTLEFGGPLLTRRGLATCRVV